MVSCARSSINADTDVHIVIAAWLFVVGTMALASGSAIGGVAFFAFAGVAPVALHAWIKARALASRSRLEQDARQRDDADAGRDQR